jgi:gamma-glutamylcysteine synthetase
VSERARALVSAELECPVLSLADHSAPAPPVFESAWDVLARGDWRRVDFGVTREGEAVPGAVCISTVQAITTDTGPTLEVVPSPSASIAGVAAQVGALAREASAVLGRLGYGMLGAGLHPAVRPVVADYRAFRTPRPSYDYVVEERGWHHWSIVNVASVQEIVDVSFDEAPRALRVLHRLAGLMNFLLRNDPDLLGDYAGRLSVRPRAWGDHVPPGARFPADAGKVGLPAREIGSWRDYLSLLWEKTPMFLIGAKTGGAAWVEQHPSFLDFLERAPEGGWPARTLAGEPVRVVPEYAHVEKTDWTYMGFARIRWKLGPSPEGLPPLLEAWRSGRIEDYLQARIEKLVIENRSTSAQPPGETLVSVALVAGLLASLEEAEALVLAEPYDFWLAVLEASTTAPLDCSVLGRPIPDLALRMVDVARCGLERRGEDRPREALGPLYRRLDEGRTPAEDLLEAYRSGGLEAVVRRSLLDGGGADLRARASARG